ncbi:hypothetical protein INR49_011854 [Caranx melampygus]|nr:hypothetical protein INR49_011854 [Caranx melampygus]
MHGYKYPADWSVAQKTQRCNQSLEVQDYTEKPEDSRCLLPILALYLLLEELSAAVLPSKFRNKRELIWLDQDHLPDRSEREDLSVGDAGDVEGRPSHAETFFIPTDQYLSLQRQHQNQNQYQYQRKASEKRRKVAPLDPIGGFQMSSFRTRKVSIKRNKMKPLHSETNRSMFFNSHTLCHII